jgi:PEP-CTERM motif
MIRFTTKALLIAALALFTFVATAPTASADGGTLDINGNDFALSNFSVSGNQVDLNAASAWDFWAVLFNSGANSFSILSDGTTYKFSGVTFWGVDLWTGGLDYTFKKESKWNTVPEPGTIFLIGSGLLALALLSSRKALRA